MSARRASRWGLGLALLAACGGDADPTPGAPAGAEPKSVESRGAGPEGASPATAAAEEGSHLRFVDGTARSGLGSFRQVNGTEEKLYITGTVGGGVALFDADGDGDLDAYLSNGSREEPFAPGSEPRDALFANDGAARFTDVTEEAGLGDANWTCGVRVADFDGDGRPEPYLTNYGPNVLYRNLGGGRFEDATERSGLGDERWSTGASFLDHDRDGDLDLYVVNYVDFDLEWVRAHEKHEDYHGTPVMFGPRGLPGEHDAFYIAEGDGRFRDASAEVGIDGPAYYGFNAVVFDVDLDGWLDLYVANDSESNLLWHNLEGERFEDVGLAMTVAMSQNGAKQAGMGVALGDYDGDLVADLFVTNFAEDYFTLYRGTGKGWFTDTTTRARIDAVTKPLLGWGCGFVDFDFDGDEDLYTVNGHVYPQVDMFELGIVYRQPNLLLENLGNGRFRRVDGGPGFALEQASRGTAEGDVDGDGDVDLLVGNLDGPPALLFNETAPRGRSLAVRLKGSAGNTGAIGARLLLQAGELHLLRLVGTQSGFLSSHEPVARFGLGALERVERLEVHWPSGEVTVLEDLAADQLLTIDASEGLLSSEPL